MCVAPLSQTQPGLLATAVSFMPQPGLLATAVPHSIQAKPRKVCTLFSFSHDCECGSVCILHLYFCDVMMSLQVM